MTDLGFAHFTTKTWAYLGMFGFSRFFFGHKFSPSPHGQITFWKYNGKYIFFTFLNTEQNAPKKNEE